MSKSYKKFAMGPQNTEWFEVASKMSGQTKAVSVGIILWRLALMNGFKRIRIPSNELKAMGIERHSFYRAIKRLESLGLIKVSRKRGALSEIDLVDEVASETTQK